MQVNTQASQPSKIGWVTYSISRLLSPFISTARPQKIADKLVQNQISTISPAGRRHLRKQKLMASMRSNCDGYKLQQRMKRVSEYYGKSDLTHGHTYSELTCPICLDLMEGPVTTICGHSFCEKCLDETLLTRADCPNCRTPIRGKLLAHCQSLRNIILRIQENMGEEDRSRYRQSQMAYNEWKSKRRPNFQEMNPGDRLDVKDTEFIWCKATLKQKFQLNGVLVSVLVHYMGWNSIYDEIISVKSDRLASRGFYTERNEIPRYRIQENEERMYSEVLRGEGNPQNAIQIQIEEPNFNLGFENSDAQQQNSDLQQIAEEQSSDTNNDSEPESGLQSDQSSQLQLQEQQQRQQLQESSEQKKQQPQQGIQDLQVTERVCSLSDYGCGSKVEQQSELEDVSSRSQGEKRESDSLI